MNPIGSKVFNSNKFVNNLDIEEFLNVSSTFFCEDTNFPFMQKDCNHIKMHNQEIWITFEVAQQITQSCL